MDNTNALLGGAILGTVGIVVLVWYVFQIIANWKIFQKAGEAGWKSIVPFYNLYTQYKLTWTAKAFWISLVVMVAGGILSSVEGSTICAVLGGLFSLAMVVISFMAYSKLSKSFGHGTGFAVGLLLFYPIFMLILAFGGSQYIGNTCETQA